MDMECPTEIKELLKVLYNLSSSETEVMYYLCDEEARASEIADDLGKDRSTVQRYLSKLRTAGLVKRDSKVEEGKRGRYYIYSVPDKDEMKEEVRTKMDEWEDEKLDLLDEI
jgi:predicted transcriptional regulator